jgi:hypothetical protein
MIGITFIDLIDFNALGNLTRFPVRDFCLAWHIDAIPDLKSSATHNISQPPLHLRVYARLQLAPRSVCGRNGSRDRQEALALIGMGVNTAMPYGIPHFARRIWYRR